MAVQERVQEPRVQEAHGVTERVRRLREESLNTQPRIYMERALLETCLLYTSPSPRD